MTTYLVFIKEIFYIRKHYKYTRQQRRPGVICFMSHHKLSLIRGVTFCHLGLIKDWLGLPATTRFSSPVCQRSIHWRGSSKRSFSASHHPSVMPINLVGVLAPSDVLTIDFFE